MNNSVLETDRRTDGQTERKVHLLSCASQLKKGIVSNQSGSELFELFDYSNSKDRIVVFGIRIRSIFKTRIVFELFE